MTLKERINDAMKQAMRAREQHRLSTLRLISAAIKDREIEARAAEDSSEETVSEDELRQILSRMVKQRQESVRAYEEGGRLELAEQERAEIEVIEEFLPRKLSDEEVDAAIEAAVTETEASSIRDMGRVMGVLKDRHMGQMDFGAVGPRVKARLSA